MVSIKELKYTISLCSSRNRWQSL